MVDTRESNIEFRKPTVPRKSVQVILADRQHCPSNNPKTTISPSLLEHTTATRSQRLPYNAHKYHNYSKMLPPKCLVTLGTYAALSGWTRFFSMPRVLFLRLLAWLLYSRGQKIWPGCGCVCKRAYINRGCKVVWQATWTVCQDRLHGIATYRDTTTHAAPIRAKDGTPTYTHTHAWVIW